MLWMLPGAVRAASLSDAKQLYFSGKYAECIDMCTDGIDNYSWYESWRQLKIECELTLGRYDDALATLEAGLESFPSSIRLRWIGHTVCLFNDRAEQAERMLEEINSLTQGQQWRYRTAADRITLGKYFLHQGADARQVLEVFYDSVKKSQPTFADTYLASGALALEKHDYAVASESFQQAAKLIPEDPAVHLGLARSFASSDPEAAEAALAKALLLNPRHVESLLQRVDHLVDAENYELAEEALTTIDTVNSEHPKACAYRAVLAHLRGDRDKAKRWRDKGLAHWRTNPAVDSLIGRKLSQKYRFAEGVAYQRAALAFDPGYVPAKIQLCQDLLRLGQDEEGWQLAADIYAQDGYNVVAHNLVILNKTLDDFKTLADDGFLLRMEASEAAIYGQTAMDLLRRAKQELCAKYDVKLNETIAVEIFPRQNDFAVRTFGMPGASGFLGVCFGHVITANSPASQGENPSNWKAVLWHEFCHVVTLEKTKNKMPRWLSEGISVYEERQANPAWGQGMTAQYREMILDGELLPVSRLSAAFLQPPSPLHLQFAYYESALVVEFLVDNYGLETLKRILDDLAEDMPINVALEQHVDALDLLDERFFEFARGRAESLAANADWETSDLPTDASIQTLRDWNEQHPESLVGLQLLAAALMRDQAWQEAKRPLTELVRLYPEDTSDDCAYRMLARAHRELGETDSERAVLTSLAVLDADAVDVYRRLIEICEAEEDWAGVAENAERLLAVNPLLRAPHRQLARAAEHLGTPLRAISSYRALVRMDPVDPAESHYRLARLLHDQGDLDDARRQVLMALEEAPRFRAAQRLLLELVDTPPGEPKPSAESELEVTP